MCNKPLDLKTMEVDHVIPESLQKKPDRLKDVLVELGRPSSFDLNSYENWLPACRPCNGRKRETIFDPSLLVQLHLQRAAERAEKARVLENRTVSKKELADALNRLQRASEAGELDEDLKRALIPLAAFQEEQRSPEMAGKAIRLSPLLELLSQKDGWQMVRGPFGVGGGPVGPHVDSSFTCVNCGTRSAWNGARCVACGDMNDE